MLRRILFVTLTNCIRQISSAGHPFFDPKLWMAVLRCIDADFRDQTVVGKLLTRSTNSTVFSWPKFSFSSKMRNVAKLSRPFLTRIKFESYGVLVADLLQDVDGHVEVVVLHRWRRVDRGKRWPIDKHQNCQEICNCTHTISWNTRSRASYYYFIYEHQHHTSLSVVLFLTRYRSWTCCWSPCGRDHDTRRRWTLPGSENSVK